MVNWIACQLNQFGFIYRVEFMMNNKSQNQTKKILLSANQVIDMHTLKDNGTYGISGDNQLINAPPVTGALTVIITYAWTDDNIKIIIQNLFGTDGQIYTETYNSKTNQWSEWAKSGGGGQKGDPGDSAYQVWLKAGHTGTENDFINSLKGANGKDGKDGAQGQQGIQGVKGETGLQGPEGKQGATGAKGDAGAQGAKGDTGAMGLGYAGLTSTTSIKIATGEISFTTNLASTATAFAVGSRIRVASKATPANFMEGLITAFSGNTLSILVDVTSGSGTFNNWVFSIGAVKMTIPVSFNSPIHTLSANDCVSQKIEFKSLSGSTQSSQLALVCKSDGLLQLDQTFPASIVAGQTLVYRGRVSIYNLDTITKSNYYINIQVIGVLAGSGQWVNLGEGSQGVLSKDKNVANEVSFSNEYSMVGGGTVCQIGVRLQLLYGQADATAFISTLYLEGNIYDANGVKLEAVSDEALIGDIDAWQVGSSSVIPKSIADLILSGKIKLIDNPDGIAASVNKKIVKTADWIMLSDGEIVILSHQEFINQFRKARLGGYYEN